MGPLDRKTVDSSHSIGSISTNNQSIPSSSDPLTDIFNNAIENLENTEITEKPEDEALATLLYGPEDEVPEEGDQTSFMNRVVMTPTAPSMDSVPDWVKDADPIKGEPLLEPSAPLETEVDFAPIASSSSAASTSSVGQTAGGIVSLRDEMANLLRNTVISVRDNRIIPKDMMSPTGEYRSPSSLSDEGMKTYQNRMRQIVENSGCSLVEITNPKNIKKGDLLYILQSTVILRGPTRKGDHVIYAAEVRTAKDSDSANKSAYKIFRVEGNPIPQERESHSSSAASSSSASSIEMEEPRASPINVTREEHSSLLKYTKSRNYNPENLTPKQAEECRNYLTLQNQLPSIENNMYSKKLNELPKIDELIKVADELGFSFVNVTNKEVLQGDLVFVLYNNKNNGDTGCFSTINDKKYFPSFRPFDDYTNYRTGEIVSFGEKQFDDLDLNKFIYLVYLIEPKKTSPP